MDRGTFETRLINIGYKNIANGAFSHVWAKEGKDFVIKVGSKIDRWPDYIEWAIIKGYAGTYAPKVYNLKYYKNFYVAVMERLVATQNEIEKEARKYSSINPIQKLVSTLKVGIYGYPDDNNHYSDAKDLIAFGRDVSQSQMVSDIHEGNIMIRKDGQLVLIDPLSGARQDSPLHIKRGQILKSETIIVINLTMEE